MQNNVGPTDRGPAGQGIAVNAFIGSFTGETITNDVIGNLVRRNGGAGISNNNNADATIAGNVVEENGFVNFAGNGIGVQAGFGADPNTRMEVRENVVRGNHEIGITILSQSNRILRNATDGNLVFDLFDGNENCDDNVWFGNSWGRGATSPSA